MKIADYNGYEMHIPTTGGKAGKGRNRTGTIQVCRIDGHSRVIVKQIRFILDEAGSRTAAINKAKDFANANQQTAKLS